MSTEIFMNLKCVQGKSSLIYEFLKVQLNIVLYEYILLKMR